MFWKCLVLNQEDKKSTVIRVLRTNHRLVNPSKTDINEQRKKYATLILDAFKINVKIMKKIQKREVCKKKKY